MKSLNIANRQKNDVLNMIDRHPGLAQSTKQQYKKAVRHYLNTGHNLTDAEALTRYAANLNQSSRAFLKAAIHLWAEQMSFEAKSSATPENVEAITATLYRLEALRNAIQTKPVKGQKAHIWLSQTQVKQMLDSCGNSLMGRRDRIVLGLLVGAGLRREECSTLCFDDMYQQPAQGQNRMVLNVSGKGAKNRVVPISDRLAEGLHEWASLIGTRSGFVARSVNKGGQLGDTLGPIGIFRIVTKVGTAIGKPELAPHSLRRTYAQLGYEAGIPLTQISKLLGHASIQTTQRYLNLELNLETTIGDFIPF